GLQTRLVAGAKVHVDIDELDHDLALILLVGCQGRRRRASRVAAHDDLALQAPGRCQFFMRYEADVGTEDQLHADRLLKLLLELVQVTGLGAVGDDDRHRWVDAGARGRQVDLELAGRAWAERGDDVCNGAREDVHALDDEHVVGAPDAADTGTGAPAGADAGAFDAHQVADPEAHERHALALDRGVDDLRQHAFLGFDRFPGFRVNDLDDDGALPEEVHPVLGFALAPDDGHEVGRAHRVVDLAAPGLFDLLPDLGEARARLAAERHRLEPERLRIQVQPLTGEVGEVVDERGAGDHVIDAGLLQDREGARRLGVARRQHRRPHRLERVVEAQPCDVPAQAYGDPGAGAGAHAGG